MVTLWSTARASRSSRGLSAALAAPETVSRTCFHPTSSAHIIISAFETCGGPNAIELMVSGHPTAVSSSSAAVSATPSTRPAVWTAAGCAQDAGPRALTGYSFTSNAMTASLCQTTCAAKGFTIAGTEYSSECYCKLVTLSTSFISAHIFHDRRQLLLERSWRHHRVFVLLHEVLR